LIRCKAHIAKWLLKLVGTPTRGRLLGIEVGVKEGNLASAMLRQEPALHMVLVDRWAAAPEGSDYARLGDGAGLAPAEVHEQWKDRAQHATAFAGHRVEIIQAESDAAALKFGPRKAQFVFIDADHSYRGRLCDLVNWWPHVVSGGIVAGGLWTSAHGGDCCARAVTAFCRCMRIECDPTFGPAKTWALRKQED